jgi:hypothetical protein
VTVHIQLLPTDVAFSNKFINIFLSPTNGLPMTDGFFDRLIDFDGVVDGIDEMNVECVLP